MKVIRNIHQMYQFSRKAGLKGKTIGFVPTMGALHKGHLSLIRQAHRENDIVVVSIFVNPAQFGAKEDFKHYPRPIKKDITLCKEEGVDFIFYPTASRMYPDGFRTYVDVEELSDCLCGESRPGHFKGVATVVTKLFNIVLPDVAYFGQKDAQQAVIIKKMLYDLNMPVKIKVLPTVREKDGLALSSRNVYLNERERKDAVVLFNSLNLARDLINRGVRDTAKIIGLMKQLIYKKKSAKIDYISIVDTDNLKPLKKISAKALVALAVWIGKMRLIDNMVIYG